MTNTARKNILIANGDDTGRANLARDVAKLGFHTRATRDLSTVIKWMKRDDWALVLLDVDLFDPQQNGFDVLQEIRTLRPDCPVIALGGENTVLSSLLSARFGAADFFAKPFSFSQLADAITQTIANKTTPSPRNTTTGFTQIAGRSKSMQPIIQQIGQAANCDHPVLITGGPGSGKTKIAQSIHQYWSGQQKPMVPLHASDPEPLAVLHHENLGEGSSLFLLHLERFAEKDKLLLCDWLRRNQTQKAPIRVFATASANVWQMADSDPILFDLLHRLNIIEITVPDLRDRRADIPDLAALFLEQASGYKMHLGKDCHAILQQHTWPANVRELQNVMTRATLAQNAPVLGKEKLQSLLSKPTDASQQNCDFASVLEPFLQHEHNQIEQWAEQGELYYQMLSLFEKPLLQFALRQTNANQVQAARKLGINRITLRKKMKIYGLLD